MSLGTNESLFFVPVSAALGKITDAKETRMKEGCPLRIVAVTDSPSVP